MQASNRARFFAGAATTALVVMLAASGARAACSTNSATVTCASTTGENDVNAAINAVAPPSVSVVVAPGATVTAGAYGAIYPGSSFKGAVSLDNAGNIGTTDTPVGFLYYGPAGAGADNTVSITNKGVITGGVGVYNTGGNIILQSSGTLAGGVSLSAGTWATTSSATSSATKTVIANASAKISGPAGTPASGSTPAHPASVYVAATGDATAEIDGLAGAVTVRSGGTDSASNRTTTSSGDTTTFTTTSSGTAVGGNASLTLGKDSTVGSVNVASGAGTATASIAGAAGSKDAPASVSIASGTTNATDTTFKSVEVTKTDATGWSDVYNSHSETTARGGDAHADLATSGAVSGSLSVASGVGAATATVAGQVAGSVSAQSTGARNLTDDLSETQTHVSSATGTVDTFIMERDRTLSAAGGSASVTVAQGARIKGDVSAIGDTAASVDNSGRIDGHVSATSNASSDSRITKVSQTNDGSGHDTYADTDTLTSQGGKASVTNRAGGIIVGGVDVNGVGGATFDNEGATYGNVTLISTGTTSVATNSQSTVTPVPSSTAATTTSTKTGFSTTRTAAGGNVSGTYAGTIGAANNDVGAGLVQHTRIAQTADGNSDATISGTLYADFFGTANGSNSTTTSSSDTSWTDTPPVAPATTATRAYAQSTENGNSSSYTSSASNATVTGRMLDNGQGTGNLSLTSWGGNAALTVNGGTIAGNSSVSADAGSSSVFTQKTVITGSGAVPTSGTVPVAATQTATTHTAYSQAGGAASATLANATLGTYANDGTYISGGSLTAQGVGTGAGSTAASVTVDAKSKAGAVSVVAGGETSVTDTTEVVTRDADGKQSGTHSQTYADANAVGNAVASVAGTVQSLSVSSGAGNATATLTGQAVNGVSVQSGSSDYSERYQSTFRPADSKTAFGSSLSSAVLMDDETITYTAVGGGANLAIDTAPALAAKGVNAVSTGNVSVTGLTSASLSVGAGSKLFDDSDYRGGSHDISVAAGGVNESYVTHTDYTAETYTEHDTRTPVTGTATFSNAGTIGSRTYAETANVLVFGSGGANASNSGLLVGNLAVNALDLGTDTTTTDTHFDDAPTRVETTVRRFSPVGGAATLSNSGLVIGSLQAAAGDGKITNSGVVEGGISVGQSVSGYTATTVTTATGSTTKVALPDSLFAQTYTVNQTGLVTGGIAVGGATIDDPSVPAGASGYLKTSNVRATINLNAGSVTLGDIKGQVDPQDPTVRLTNTTLNLNGTGFLGVGPNATLPAGSSPDLESALASALGAGKDAAYAYTPDYARFVALDPGADGIGTLTATKLTPGAALSLAASGSRITGVETVDKTGGGTFTIVGAAYQSPTADTPDARYTMDIGTLKVSSGELQLGVAGSDPATGAAIFGIRGNVDVNGGTLTLGRTVTYGGNSVTLGTHVLIDGKLNEGASGTLALGAAPTLIRQFGTLVLPTQAQGLLGYGQYGVTLSPFVPYGQQYIGLASTPGTLSVSGNVTLAGAIKVAATPGALYLAGRDYDVMTIDGKFSSTAKVTSNLPSPFVSFVLTPRTEGGKTIVSLDVVRTPYASVTSTKNAAAAADALDAAMPKVVKALSSLTSPQAVTDVQAYGNQQDLATVMAALDTSLAPAQATEVLNELGTGSFYGSLSAISTTATFGDVPEATSGGRGLGLWFRPTGSFAHYSASGATGAAALHVSNYGGSLGFNLLTGDNGYFGFAGGYSHTRAHDIDSPQDASADTYMGGFYGAQSWDKLHVSGQAVFGWSNWKADRKLPLLERTANAKFDSKEFRLTAQASYDFGFGGAIVSPFAKINLRHYTFDGFDETNAGGIGLHVHGQSKTVFNPEIGARVSGTFGAVQPYAQASYVFQGHVGSDRTVSYLGDPSTTFLLRGVDPRGYANLGAGVQADLGIATVFAGGNYLTGGHQHAGEVKGGMLVKF